MESVNARSDEATKSITNVVFHQKENGLSECSPVISKRIKQPYSIRARYQKPQPNLSSVKRATSSVVHNDSNSLRCHENKTTAESNGAILELSENTAEESAANKSSVEKKKNMFPTLTTILNTKKKPENEMVDKRKKYSKKEKVPLERSKMTIVDLIHFNPSTPVMQTKTPNTSTDVPKSGFPVSSNPEESPTSVEIENEEENFQTVPKLTISENGEIHIDQNSLFVQRNLPEVSATQVVNEDETTYCSYRKAINTKWGAKETFKFYKALSLFGSDFSIMQTVFPNRTRRELKLKFKREERLNRKLINKAMYDVLSFDMNAAEETYKELLTSESEDIVEFGDEDNPVSDECKKLKTSRKKRRKKAPNEIIDEECRKQYATDASDNLQNNKDESVCRRRKRKAKVLDDFIDVDEVCLGSDDDVSCEYIPETEASALMETVHEASTQPSPRDAVEVHSSRANSELINASITISNKDSVKVPEEFTSTEIILTIIDSNQNSLTNGRTEINDQHCESEKIIEISTNEHNGISSEQVAGPVLSNGVEINNAVQIALIPEQSYSEIPLCTNELSAPLFSQTYKQEEHMQICISENITNEHPDTAEKCTMPVLKEHELENSAVSSLFLLNSNECISCEKQSEFVCSDFPNHDETSHIDLIGNNPSEVKNNSSEPLSPPVLSKRYRRKSSQIHPKLSRNDVSNNSPTLGFSENFEEIKSLPTDFIAQASDSNELALLTDVVADEIVSSIKSNKKKSKQKRTTHKNNLRNTCLSSAKQNHRNFLPSSTVYTPSEEFPSCSKVQNLKTYSRKKRTPDIPDLGLPSLEISCTPDISFNSENCEPEMLGSSVNIDKSNSVRAPVTPSPSNKSVSPSPLMIFAKAPNEENILHLFMYNNVDKPNESQNSSETRNFLEIST